jgi:malonyl-CoA decarboxylase
MPEVRPLPLQNWDRRLNVSFFQELLAAVAEQGRQLLPRALRTSDSTAGIIELAKALVSVRGEASGVAIAQQILSLYRGLSPEQKQVFFRFLAEELEPPEEQVRAAARAYAAKPSQETLARLQRAVESPRQEFFRRLNLAPGATGEIVKMRRDLLRDFTNPDLQAVDADLRHLLYSWFNRGFLVLRRIDWQTPAAILEKIIAYEAVHAINGWDDLRRRLDPADRRCFAFFHPSLNDEPLIFVEVALMDDSPETIASVLDEAQKPSDASEPTTAVFYSISNCQEGLKGISFGHFLIKQVVEELAKEKPSLKTFVTLSPMPGFARWLQDVAADENSQLLTGEARAVIESLSDPMWFEEPELARQLEPVLMPLAAHYLLAAKADDQRPIDPVARFHLGNGARLERINWLADVSTKGLREAHGLMVNYRYEIKEIERNHEAYVNEGTVASSRAVRALMKTPVKVKRLPEPKRLPSPQPSDEALAGQPEPSKP